MEDLKAFSDLKAIYGAGVKRVAPYDMIMSRVCIVDNTLRIVHDHGIESVPLQGFEEICVIGAGKACAPMAKAMEEILGQRLCRGLISVKKGHTTPLKTIEVIEAGHPVPDQNSQAAAERITRMADAAKETTLFINLISGGGSALLSLPRTLDGISLTLEDKQAVTEQLLACGADINEINSVRKHLSGIKGGQLAKRMYPSTSVSLILSDVVGDSLSTIASGPTAPDPTTFNQALSVLKKYRIEKTVPSKVLELINRGAQKEKGLQGLSEAKIFSKTCNILLGNNLSALIAAQKKAEELNYNTLVLTSQITGEARQVAKVFSGIARETAARDLPVAKPACILAGGETTVTILGNGKGGRNQEMALAFLDELNRYPEKASRIFFLSGATDGNDGPTDAAGAFAAQSVLTLVQKKGLNIQAALNNNDAYTFFDAIDRLFKPGPTNTNVCDLQIIIIV